MKTLVILLGIAIAILGGTLVYAKHLPAETTHSESVRLAGDASVVWAKLANMQDYPSWRSGMRAVMPVSEDSISLVEWKEVYTRQLLLATRTHVLIPDSMVLEILPESRNQKSTWVWSLEPLPPDSTLVTLQSRRILGTPLYRLFHRVFGSQDEQQLLAIQDIQRALSH